MSFFGILLNVVQANFFQIYVVPAKVLASFLLTKVTFKLTSVQLKITSTLVDTLLDVGVMGMNNIFEIINSNRKSRVPLPVQVPF